VLRLSIEIRYPSEAADYPTSTRERPGAREGHARGHAAGPRDTCGPLCTPAALTSPPLARRRGAMAGAVPACRLELLSSDWELGFRST